MGFTASDLDWAVEEKLLTAEQARALREALEKRHEERPQFSLSHVTYYLGALIIISSMSWFMVTSWESLGGGGILAISLVLGLGLAAAGMALWRRPGTRIPGGLLVAAAVSITPLAVYGFQKLMGWWPADMPRSYHEYHVLVRGYWIWMELATLATGTLALRYVRFPFLTAPIAFTLWYMSMDLSPLLFADDDLQWSRRKWVSVGWGALVLLGSYLADRRTKDDFAFWGYLFGLMAFWGGLTAMDSHSELGKFVYFLINLSLLLKSVYLDRRAFAVFGAMGIFLYVGHLAESVFKESLLFPLAMSATGLGVIGLGYVFQQNRAQIEGALLAALPEGLRRMRPQHRHRL